MKSELDRVDDAVIVWVATARDVERMDYPIVTGWSDLEAAKAWCRSEIDADEDAITWTETRGTKPGRQVAGHRDGALVAKIQQIEILDPICLAQQYTMEMPGATTFVDRE